MSELKLVFKDNVADEYEGINDSGIQTFKRAPYASCGREAGQNSRDKMIRSPVKMTFKLREINKADLPFHRELSSTISTCLNAVSQTGDTKEIDFFIKADGILKADKIKVLEISDYNTTGLEGPVEWGSSFHSLVKAAGKSGNNSSEDSSGSFGIGKNATFAVSDLQTVIYSTVYKNKDDGKEIFLCQGKTKLISHKTADGKNKSATGYWGDDDFKEIADPNLVPPWMRREEVGTSIFAVGFPKEDSWDYRIAAALLSTFFIALSKGEMEISVGELKLNNATIEDLFWDEKIVNAAEDSDSFDQFEFARQLYNCETNSETIEKVITTDPVEDMDFGRLSVKILKKDGLPKRLAFIRNGILITDNLQHFNEPFRTFPSCSSFIALVQIMDKEGSAIFKLIENPEHNQVATGGVSDEEKRKKINTLMKRIGKELRKVINDLTRFHPDRVESLDELAEFFPDDNHKKAEDTGESNPQIFRYKPKPIKPKQKKRIGKGSSGQSGGSGSGEKRKKQGGGNGGINPGLGKGKHGTKKDYTLLDQRYIALTSNRRKLLFTPEEDGKARIFIFSTGLVDRENLVIESVDGKKVSGGKWIIDLDKKKRHQAEIELKDDYSGPIEIEAIGY